MNSVTKEIYREVYRGLIGSEESDSPVERAFDVCVDNDSVWSVMSGTDPTNAVLRNVQLSDFFPDGPASQVTEEEFLAMIEDGGAEDLVTD